MLDIFDKNIARILIFGGRDLNEQRCLVMLRQWFDPIVHFHLPDYDTFEVISGKASGGDRAGEMYAVERGYRIIPFEAEWEKYGRKRAGAIRNRRMRDEGKPHLGISFIGGSGTGNMRSLLDERHILWVELREGGVTGGLRIRDY